MTDNVVERWRGHDGGPYRARIKHDDAVLLPRPRVWHLAVLLGNGIPYRARLSWANRDQGRDDSGDGKGSRSMTDDVVERWRRYREDSDAREGLLKAGDALAAEVSRLRVRDSNLTFHDRNVMAVNQHLRERLEAAERLAAEWSEIEDGTWSTYAEKLLEVLGRRTK